MTGISLQSRAAIILLISLWLLLNFIRGESLYHNQFEDVSFSDSTSENDPLDKRDYHGKIELLNIEMKETLTQLELYRSKANTLQKMLLTMKNISNELMIQSGITERKSRSADEIIIQKWRHRDVERTKFLDDWFQIDGSWFADEAHSSGCCIYDLLTFRSSFDSRSRKSPRQKEVEALYLQYLMVLDTSTGAMELRSPTTREILWQHDFELRGIRSIVFSSERKNNHFALVTSSGKVSLYKVRIYHDRKVLSGSYRRKNKYDPVICQKRSTKSTDILHLPSFFGISNGLTTPPQDQVHFEFEPIFSIPGRRASNLLKPKIALVRHTQGTFLVTGDERGLIQIFNLNGTRVGYENRSASIQDFAVLSSGIIAYAIQNKIELLDVITQRILNFSCFGSNDMITSLQRDFWKGNVLYAGTAKGHVLTFRVHKMGHVRRYHNYTSTNYRENEPFCILVQKLTPQRRYHEEKNIGVIHSTINNLPGYVVFATRHHVVLYATQDGHPKYVAEALIKCDLNSSYDSKSCKVHSLHTTSSLDRSIALMVQVLEPSGPRIDTFIATLPESQVSNYLWLRAPLMLLCIAGVLFWQKSQTAVSKSQFDHLDTRRIMAQRDWSKFKTSTNEAFPPPIPVI
jgi:hypothetical protein